MAEVRVTLDDDGRAYVRLVDTDVEIRTTVELDELDATEAVPSLAGIRLDFDFYGRLAGIEVIDSAASVLPPSLLDAAESA